MKALVTGSTGFVGSHLCQKLLDAGHEVIAFGRNEKKGEALKTSGARFISLDLADPKQLTNLQEDIDVVFHCAALSSAWGKEQDFHLHNVDVTERLLNWSHARSVKRFIYVSSSSVYFDFRDRLMINETDTVASPFVNAYAKSKYAGEQCCLAAKHYSLEPVIIRPRGIIGKGDNSIMPRILQVASRGTFPLINKGEALIDLTCVTNLADALILAAETPNIGGEIFNISNDQPMTIYTLASLAFEAMEKNIRFRSMPYWLLDKTARLLEQWSQMTSGKEPVITRYSAGLLAHSQTLNIEKAKSRLGYRPNMSLEEGIAQYGQS